MWDVEFGMGALQAKVIGSLEKRGWGVTLLHAKMPQHHLLLPGNVV
jgi:hypothetical protein